MRTLPAMLLCATFALASYGCATPPPSANRPVELSCPKPAPAPSDVMVERKADFLTRLLDFFSPSPGKPTP